MRVLLRFWADIEAVTNGLAEKINAPELPDGAESHNVHLEAERAKMIFEYLDPYQYASRRHAVMTLLWHTGMRRSALCSLDLDDMRPDENALVLEHRPETGTKLKNGDNENRWVYFGPEPFQVLDEYVSENRHDVTDDYGRDPLITSRKGQPMGDTVYKWLQRATWPCEYGDCPHDRGPVDCEAVGSRNVPRKYPSSRSPHAIRRGSITEHLNDDVPPETVSERMDVSLEVLYEHYEARIARGKMEVRKKHLK